MPATSPAALAARGIETPEATVAPEKETNKPGPEIEQNEERQSKEREANSSLLFIFTIGLAIAVGYVVFTRVIRGNRA